jgi:hypothetical protein
VTDSGHPSTQPPRTQRRFRESIGDMTSTPLVVDHIVIAVPDLDLAAARLDVEHGLTALEGGRHPGWGTANRIVPLGSSYLELVTVIDPGEASSSTFGTWVTRMLDDGGSTGPAPMGWAVRTDHIAAEAGERGLEIVDGARRSRTGALLTWRLAGVARAAADPALPFLIEWGEGTPLPGTSAVEHRAGDDVQLSELLICGDDVALHDWLGGADLPARVSPTGNAQGVTTVVLTVGGVQTALGPASLR